MHVYVLEVFAARNDLVEPIWLHIIRTGIVTMSLLLSPCYACVHDGAGRH